MAFPFQIDLHSKKENLYLLTVCNFLFSNKGRYIANPFSGISRPLPTTKLGHPNRDSKLLYPKSVHNHDLLGVTLSLQNKKKTHLFFQAIKVIWV